MKIGVGYAAWVTSPKLMEYAVDTLNSITSEKHELVFCGWRNSPMPSDVFAKLGSYGHIHDNDENNVSRAWNRAINHLIGQGCRYVFVPNLDIYLKPGALDALVDAAQRYPNPVLWTMANWHYFQDDGEAPGIHRAPTPDHVVPHPHFSAFMVDNRLFDKVGPFDENFRPAYNEDLDMHWRIRLAGEEAVQFEGARFYHYGSRAIGEDKALEATNRITHANLDRYFARKWGYKPPTADDPFTTGMYRHPWNDPSLVGYERKFMATW